MQVWVHGNHSVHVYYALKLSVHACLHIKSVGMMNRMVIPLRTKQSQRKAKALYASLCENLGERGLPKTKDVGDCSAHPLQWEA